MHGDPVEDPRLHREVARSERDHRRRAGRVEVAVAAEVVTTRREAGEEARQHLEGAARAEIAIIPLQCGTRPCRAARPLSLQNRNRGRRTWTGEDPLLRVAARLSQPLDVLVGTAFGAGDLAATQRRAGATTAGARPACMRQPPRACCRVQQVDVVAEVERLVEVDQPLQPVGVDVARVVRRRPRTRTWRPVDNEV